MTRTSSSELVFSWQSVSNKIYEIELSRDLVSGTWRVVASNILATPPANEIPCPLAGPSRRYFRLKVTD
jgi:hypothetical protein